MNRGNHARPVPAWLCARKLRLGEAERLPRVTQQESGQDGRLSPGCLSEPTPLWTGARPWPRRTGRPSGVGAPGGERDPGLCPEPLGDERPGCEEPGAPSDFSSLPSVPEMLGLGLVRRPGALFSLQSGGLAGLCGIYLFTQELSSEARAEGIGSSGASLRIFGGGPSHSSLKGLRPSKKAVGETD